MSAGALNTLDALTTEIDALEAAIEAVAPVVTEGDAEAKLNALGQIRQRVGRRFCFDAIRPSSRRRLWTRSAATRPRALGAVRFGGAATDPGIVLRRDSSSVGPCARRRRALGPRT